jgi:hypothetical protein
LDESEEFELLKRFRASTKIVPLRIEPLERVILEENGLEMLASTSITDLLHMNAVQLCGLAAAGYECSKHEVGIARPSKVSK